MAALILLDTHVVLWWLLDPRRMSARASRAVAEAKTLLINPISCWEITLLHAQGRIQLDLEPLVWTQTLFRMDRVDVAPLTPGGAVAAASLTAPFPNDPADRFIYATARTMAVPLVTKDLRLRVYARDHGMRTIW